MIFPLNLIFRKKKKKDDEDDELEDDELDDEDDEDDSHGKKPKKIKDLAPQNKRKRKEPIKPWGKIERSIVLVVLFLTVAGSGVLALMARNWKLPNSQRIVVPNLSNPLEKKITIESTNKNKEEEKEVEEIVNKFKESSNKLSGIYGLSVIRLDSGVSYGVYQNEVFEAASVIKLPVIAALYVYDEQGQIDIDSSYYLKDSDKVGGSGWIIGQKAGTKFTLRELASAMGQQSDNTAFRIIINYLGKAKINEVIKNLGMTKTNIDENTTSPSDVSLFFQKLWKGEIVNPKNTNEILKILTNTGYENYLPKSVDDGIKVSHKYGRELHVLNDAGIVFTPKPYVIGIFTKGIVESEVEENFVKLGNIIFEAEKSR